MGYEQEIHMELTNYHEGLFFFKKKSFSIDDYLGCTCKSICWDIKPHNKMWWVGDGNTFHHKFRSQMSYKDLDQEYPQEKHLGFLEIKVSLFFTIFPE